MATRFDRIRDELKALDIRLTQHGYEYHVNWGHGHKRADYVTDDLDDARDHGLALSQLPSPPRPEPPMGPLPNSRSMKSFIKRWNFSIALKRAKRASGKKDTNRKAE